MDLSCAGPCAGPCAGSFDRSWRAQLNTRPTEYNFDGIPGPTHNYSGLAPDNLASERNMRRVANPRRAALQGLAKIRAFAQRGIPQAVLPPHERPAMQLLRALGFTGSDATVLARAAREAPAALAASASAAAMWVANAATVSPSADTADGRVHFTPANLVAHAHRAQEAAVTTRILRSIFADPARFHVHDPLPGAPQFGDEGAANHTRLTAISGIHAPAVEFFVFGRRGFGGGPGPSRFVARQTLEASQAVARRHGLDPALTVFAQQHPAAIDAGVFHNDVIAVGHDNVLICHERAFLDQHAVLAELARRVGPQFVPIVVHDTDVGLVEAVATYLFNSQLVTRADGGLLLVAPAEVDENPRVAAWVAQLVTSGGPVAEVATFDLRESMRNGGGPACLRLRVALTAAERAAVTANVFLDDALAADLEAWIHRHYRDRLAPADLGDPSLLDESRRALDELSALLRLGSVYPFQTA